MRRLLALGMLLSLVTPGFADYDEGIDYQLVATPQPVADPDRVEVLELFWYGCPHCYHLEDELDAWRRQQPEDVAFVRAPAVLGPSWELLARAYYTAELLDALDRIHTPLFEYLHKQRKAIRNVSQLRGFFVQQGVSAEDFDKTFNSFAVVTKTNRAREIHNRYGVTGVPTLVVNGKYRTSASLAGSNEKMLEVVDYLVEQERQAVAGQAED